MPKSDKDKTDASKSAKNDTKDKTSKSAKIAKLETKEDVMNIGEGVGGPFSEWDELIVYETDTDVSSQMRGEDSTADVYLMRSRHHSNEFEDEE